jgi:hypothetical protein
MRRSSCSCTEDGNYKQEMRSVAAVQPPGLMLQAQCDAAAAQIKQAEVQMRYSVVLNAPAAQFKAHSSSRMRRSSCKKQTCIYAGVDE